MNFPMSKHCANKRKTPSSQLEESTLDIHLITPSFPTMLALCKREQSPVLTVGRVHPGHTYNIAKLPHCASAMQKRAMPCPQLEESTLDIHTIMANFPTASARQKRAKPCLHSWKSPLWTQTPSTSLQHPSFLQPLPYLVFRWCSNSSKFVTIQTILVLFATSSVIKQTSDII